MVSHYFYCHLVSFTGKWSTRNVPPKDGGNYGGNIGSSDSSEAASATARSAWGITNAPFGGLSIGKLRQQWSLMTLSKMIFNQIEAEIHHLI